jgi:AAA family ATP:ADP antiporter
MPEVEDEPLKKGGAFAMVFRTHYLLLIALLMLVLNWVNTTGEYILGRTVVSAAEQAMASGTAGGLSKEEFIGGFYADFFTVVNIAGLLLQLFVVSRVLKYFGVGVAIMILPLIALGGYLIAAFYPVLAMVRWAKTAENATDYSVQNTVRQVLFLPTTREQKYKAKQAIDTFFVRAGDVLSAVVVFAGTTWLSLSTQGFALFNVALVAAWLVLAVMIGRRYRQITVG